MPLKEQRLECRGKSGAPDTGHATRDTSQDIVGCTEGHFVDANTEAAIPLRGGILGGFAFF